MTEKTDEKKDPPIPKPGTCPKCYHKYLSTETGYYCPYCGDMGWFTWDDYLYD